MPPIVIAARIHLVYACDQVEEGRFARAGWPHEGEKLTLFDGKGDVLSTGTPVLPRWYALLTWSILRRWAFSSMSLPSIATFDPSLSRPGD